jgi:pimeloyl-ACP methyl ester carboxylesterase
MAALDRAYYDLAVAPERTAAVTMPMLGIVGSLDPARTRLEALRQLRPDVKLVIVDGATHGGDRGVVARPEFIRELRAFIAAHQISSR